LAGLGDIRLYNDGGKLEAIELTAAAQPTLGEHTLTYMPLQQAAHLLRGLDAETEIKRGSATSKTLGIAVWTGATMHGIVQAVLCFEAGYYDR
jgi:hypothetical protein